jgi:hypothetical protein
MLTEGSSLPIQLRPINIRFLVQGDDLGQLFSLVVMFLPAEVGSPTLQELAGVHGNTLPSIQKIPEETSKFHFKQLRKAFDLKPLGLTSAKPAPMRLISKRTQPIASPT